MTIQLKLDTNALSSLIEKDPTFTLQLQQAVLENVARRYIKGVPDDIAKAINVAGDEMRRKLLDEYGEYKRNNTGWGSSFVLKNMISEDVKNAVEKASFQQLETLVNTAVEKQLDYMKEIIRSKVEREISVITTSAVKAAVEQKVAIVVKEKVAEAISNLKI